MAISNAFKGAYVNQINQQNAGIGTITQGVKDLAVTAAGIAGFSGALGSGALAQGAMHAFAGKVGGIGGNIMLSTLMEKEDTAKGQKEIDNLFTGEEVADTINSTLGDNPINRSAKKQLTTVFNALQNAKAEKIINKKGNMENLTTPEKSFMLDDENVSYFDKKQLSSLRKRGITGDALLDANDLAKEILDVGGEITKDGKVRVFHATTPENAKEINRTGQMFGKEDKIYFSTKRDGEIKGYGNAIVEAEIPIEKLQANDLFADEIHLTIDTGVPGRRVNIREEDK